MYVIYKHACNKGPGSKRFCRWSIWSKNFGAIITLDPPSNVGNSCKVLVQPKLKQRGGILGNPPRKPHWPTELQHSPQAPSQHLPTAWGPHGIWHLLLPQDPLTLWAPIYKVPLGQKTGPHPRNPLSFQNNWPCPSRLLFFQEQTFHSRVCDAEGSRKLVPFRSLDPLSGIHLVCLTKYICYWTEKKHELGLQIDRW